MALNSNLSETLTRLRLRRSGGGLAWGWASDDESLLRECASEHCSWLFVDRSRTLRRRQKAEKACSTSQRS